MKQEAPLFLYFGHHKCASTTIHNIFQELMVSLGRKHSCITYPHLDILPLVHRHRIDSLSVRLADYKKIEDLDNFRGFHLIRDPRDIVISAYFSHRYSHPTKNWPALENHRNQLNNVSQEEGLFLEMDFQVTRETLNALEDWNYKNPNILELKFEDFSADPKQVLIDIFSFLDLLETHNNYSESLFRFLTEYNRCIQSYRLLRPFKLYLKKMNHQELNRVVNKFSFEKLSGGRKLGQSDKKNHYRKGKSNDWKDYFTEAHKSLFKKRYQKVLEVTGYENNTHW